MSIANQSEPVAGAAIASAEQLAAAREARGWSAADVASKLGMVPRQIEAIERGDWAALPGPAFVRGAIRAYGKALQVDVAPLVDSAGAAVHASELRPASTLDAPLPGRGALGFDGGGSGSRLTWILLAVLGVIAIAMYFGRGGQWSRIIEGDGDGARAPGRALETVPLQPPAAPPEPEGAPSRPVPSQSTEPSAPSAPSAPPAAVTEATRPDAQPVEAASRQAPTASTPAQTAATAAAAAPADRAPVLRFEFERDSWVEVRDAGGKLLLHGTQPGGSTREVAGRRPYSVVVGNAAHVRLSDNGRAIDIAAPARRGVTRLNVD